MRNRLMTLILAGALLPALPAQAGWEQGVAAFAKAFDELIGALDTKAAELGAA